MRPTLCSRCNKNVAVIFITKIENGKSTNEGLCLKCAKELGIGPVNDVLQKMGIDDEQLAKMDEEQKKNYEIAQWKERAEKAEKLNAISQLKSETIKQATEKGISLEFINTINFEFETAETIKSKLEILEKAVKKEREIAINEYSKEDAPQTGDRVQTTDFSKMSYDELAEYLNKHPEAKI